MAMVLVRGAGDVGSAVALHLREAGHAVVVHDDPFPAHPRRGMAFTDAFYDGTSLLEGVRAKRARDMADLAPMVACGRAIPVSDAALPDVIAALDPDAVVDARMRKHAPAEARGDPGRLCVGLGPGFVAGENADVVVETSWGEALGRVIREGAARGLEGEPHPLAGRGRERFVYAPVAGILRTPLAIGDPVRAGDEVARIGGTAIRAPLDGVLRGLSHDGAEVSEGAKIVEVDPRGERSAAFGVGERPAKIAAGVAAALEEVLGRA